ncbi:carboxypeptidase-like regulatory domain-containing protein [Seonamhaeicola sp. MEBiC1930]|uniref:alpha-2-macroglobulin family protein n=1 Tax=Seonamhaeicola sp. MEBiC01930 TaxID=2976768 RepID=UPI0032515947
MTILFAVHSQAQNSDYETLWAKVEQFEIAGLPKSALKIVETIKTKAEKDKNTPQLIKTMLFKNKFALVLEEDAQLKIINNFKAAIEAHSFPTKNVLENILANLYWQYFNQNRYKFYNRTKVANALEVSNGDFRTWDLQTLFNQIHKHYQNSLQNGLMLQLEPLNKYDVIINTQKNSRVFRPSLYDFLSHNALEFYKTNETHIIKPAYKFEIDNPEFLGDANTFSNLKIESKDSTSLQLNALKIYQDLIQFHLKDESPKALASVNIERLKFVNQHAVFNDKQNILLKALKTESEGYKDHEVSTLYDYEIASIYYQLSEKYKPKTSEANRWKAKEAIDICNKVIVAFPKSTGAKKCKILKQQIEQKSLNITAEEFLAIQKHSRVLVRYKNIDSLYFKAYRINERQLERFNRIYSQDDRWTFFNKLDVSKTWETKLTNEYDFHSHTTEVLVPKLDNGRYLIVSTTSKKSQSTYAFTTLQVTNLALVDSESNTHQIFQIINRNNGKPVVNADVELSFYIKNSKSKQTQNHITNNIGQVHIKKDHNYYRNIALKVKTDEDLAYFGNYWMGTYQKEDKEETQYKAFIFTDRSIYRPGQTVYFKAITLKTKNGKSEVIPNEDFYVDVFNSNDEDIAELEFKTNEFGAISGEFVLPNNGLNGDYYIELWADSNKIDIDVEHRFLVEEYKRPKFETKFKPLKETYKINDSVTVKGNAIAYAGSNITNAKVVYRVHRKVQYPPWYYWYRPYFTNEPQEIAHGECTTNDNGEFEILFKALPDKSVDKTTLPIFKYEVTADVTDVNGETRSATTIVNVGYHALNANITIANTLDKSKKDYAININTENLNGEFVPAKGLVKIYKLMAPHSVVRPRSWDAPDYQAFSKEVFKNLFPNDAYFNEDDSKNWKKGKLVFEKDFNTKDSKILELGKIKKWISGKYLIILESQDKFGQNVRDEAKITLYSDTDKTIADNQLFSITPNKSSYNIGDTANITFASAAENLNVTVSIEKDKKIVQTEIIQLNNNKKVISVPVDKSNIGGFVIHYSFAAFNSFQTGSQTITVPYPKTDLEIETNTFRDRLQPGTDETWSFNIKGPKGDKVSAELLASMYDASLDQFKPHTWSFNPINNPVYYATFRSNANQSFGNRTFRVYNVKKHGNNYPQQYYDQLNWFGFSMQFNQWRYKNYLNSIKPKYESRHEEKYDDTVKKNIITGTVYSASDNSPLPAANVIIKNTSRGTTTDFDGRFSIKANKNDVLEFTFIGFITHEVKITNNNTFNIYLSEDASELDEVVVMGYGTQKKASISAAISTVTTENSPGVEAALQGRIAGLTVNNAAGANAEVQIRGANSIASKNKPLYIVDGKIIEGDLDILGIDVQSIEVLEDSSATAIYGSKAANGVVLISTKKGLNALTQVQVRKNLKETAFFFPHLKTDENGNISFSFTTPEALTQWKLQLLAHTKTLESATRTLTTVTQKELMVIPNAPRFLREGDQITISTKIANLTEQQLSGDAILILTDAITGNSIDTKLGNAANTKAFTVDSKGNTQVSWNLSIPDYIQAIQYKVIAKTDAFSDGEQNALPVLSNRMMITETLPMWIKSNETRTFSLDKLKNVTSTSLSHHKLTLEITSNPAWYAIQALPYLMEYPYDCNEQTFSRYYANTLASHIANSNPRIQEVFNQWASQDILISNLEKNQELKSILIQETPWLRDAQSESEQKKRIALLFDLNKMNNELQSALNKLESNQMSSGAWAWFNGGRENRWITQHIITGFGHLKQLYVIQSDSEESQMIKRAIKYLDSKFIEEYKNLRKYDKHVDLSKDHLSNTQLHYLYMRSFHPEIKKSKETEDISKYYHTQIQKYWLNRSLYSKGLMALVSHRMNDNKTTSKILKSLKENSITNEELGMYWKENTNSWYWYQAPIETQALLIEVFSEAGSTIQSETKNLETIDNLKIWLLKNKQTNRWKTTKATTDAIYALLLQGSDWLSVSEMVDVVLGGKKIEPSKLEGVKIEAGTGYFKTSWNTSEIQPDMGEVKLTKKGNGIAWGGLYWQYFENLDKITSAETSLKLEKKLFLKKNTHTGEEISEITNETLLKVGDLVRVRIELRNDRAMEFVHMKDMRAAGLEPINVLSKYKWQDGLGYYESTKDASTNFFFDYLPKGVYVFEYDLRVNNSGNMSNGITTIQSMYAPEFSSHSEGVRIQVN